MIGGAGRGGEQAEQEQRADGLGRLAGVEPEQDEEAGAEQPDRARRGPPRPGGSSGREQQWPPDHGQDDGDADRDDEPRPRSGRR